MFPYDAVFPRSGANGGNAYWRTRLDQLRLTSTQLRDDVISVPLRRKTPFGRSGWGCMLSVVDGSLARVLLEDLDPAVVQETLRESGRYTLDVLKDPLRPRDAVRTTPRCRALLPPTPPAMYLILM